MLNDEEYSSDTSDEDFVPAGVESEDENDLTDVEDEHLVQNSGDENPNSNKKRKQKTTKKISSKKQRKVNPLLASLGEAESSSKNEDIDTIIEDTAAQDPKKDDDLWADFLADVEESKPQVAKPSKPQVSWSALLGGKKKQKEQKQMKESENLKNGAGTVSSCAPTGALSKPSTVKITKIFEFAGEEVRVEEEVPADSNSSKSTHSSNNTTAPRNSGLSNLMNFLGNKNKKLSTLEKSKLDWKNFKADEGIEDELQTHLKSKDGYLEKKEFLERTDLRQFEIERGMRMKQRSNR